MTEPLLWDPSSTQGSLSISADGTSLSWDTTPTGVKPAWLGSQAKTRLESGRFRWTFEVETAAHQIGVGILVEPLDWGFFGYLGAGRNAWSYDAHQGAIVTETVAVHSSLPCVTGSGIVAVELDLLKEHTCTFVVNGVATPPIALPSGKAVLPAACLLAVGQRETLRDFEVVQTGTVALADAEAAKGRLREVAALIDDRLWEQGPGRRKAAEQQFEQLQSELAERPDDVDLLRRAYVVLEACQPNPDEGDAVFLDLLRRITTLHPDDWEAWRWSAFYLGRLDRREEQLLCWNRLIAALPASGEGAFQGKLARAETYGDMLARQMGAAAYFWSAKASCFAELNRRSEAEQCYIRAIELSPQHPGLMKDMADLLVECERWAEAETLYQRVLALQPTFVHARLQRAICLARQDRYNEAIAEADGAVNRSMLGPLELSAYLRVKTGDDVGAERCLEEHMREHPYSHPLFDDRERLSGFEIDDSFRALADRVFERFAHLRRDS